MDLHDQLMTERKEQAQRWRERRGSDIGFAECWYDIEPEIIATLKADATGGPNDHTPEHNRAPDKANARMTPAEKTAFMREHGRDAYFNFVAKEATEKAGNL